MTGFTLTLNLHHVMPEAIGEVWKLVEAALLKSPNSHPIPELAQRNCGCSRAGISLQQQQKWGSLCPSPAAAAVGQGHSAKCTGGMGSRRNPQSLTPAQCSKLRCRCAVVLSKSPQMHLKHNQVWFYHPQSRINPGRLSLWNTWFITHPFFYNTRFFFYSLFRKCITSKHELLPRCLKELKC